MCASKDVERRTEPELRNWGFNLVLLALFQLRLGLAAARLLLLEELLVRATLLRRLDLS